MELWQVQPVSLEIHPWMSSRPGCRYEWGLSVGIRALARGWCLRTLACGVLQGLEAHKYRNTLDCALKILKNEGPKA